MNRAITRAHGLLVTTGLLLFAGERAQGQVGGGGFGEIGDPIDVAAYDLVDNVEGDWVHLMNPPYRPMVLDGGDAFWAVDNHQSEVHRFELAAGSAPVQTIGVPSGPVSIALWTDAAAKKHLIVVCRSSWVVCLIDADSGTLLEVRQMEDSATGRQLGEPADIAVTTDAGGAPVAWVSCSASDAVVKLSLPGLAIQQVVYLPAKHPTFLSTDAAGNVYVVPQVSGNGTFVDREDEAHSRNADEHEIIDGDVSSLVQTGLNDYDVFRIDPSGALAPIARGVGTILFDHAVTPGGKLWVLNTEAQNADFVKEPSLGVDLALNRLSIVDPAAGFPDVPVSIIDVDALPAGGYAADRSVGQPFNLTVLSNGYGFATGLLTDNFVGFNASGTPVGEFDLLEGTIPRGIVFSEPELLLLVYCWGTNTIEGFGLLDLTTRSHEFDLGFDPTPAAIKAGRETFFDASNSANHRFSCATCHVDGGFDGLAWNLGVPEDSNGPMLTQTMTGLETQHPFHWRGEQKGDRANRQFMVDFNAAFVDLMGGVQLETVTNSDWDDFEAFVFSMQSPANPNQHIRRVLDASVQTPLEPGGPAGDPLDGRDLFAPQLNTGCASCHALPKGTTNDIVADGNQHEDPYRQDFKIAPFQEDYRWDQDADPATPGIQYEVVTFTDSSMLPDDYPPLGTSHSHAGLEPSLHSFIKVFDLLSNQEQADATAFIHQWDNGLAPVVHRAYFVDATASQNVIDQVQYYLVPQCTDRMKTFSGQEIVNGDLAAIGTYKPVAGPARPMRWYWHRTLELFEPEDATVGWQPLSVLLQQAAAGESYTTFIGLPLGTGRRFAIDFDGDGLPNVDELNYPGGGTDPDVVDSDGDGDWDGHEHDNGGDPTNGAIGSDDTDAPTFVDGPEMLWVTARTAVLRFEVSEPARATIDYSSNTSGDALANPIQTGYALRHRIVLPDLDPGQQYDVDVDLVDLGGLPAHDDVLFSTLGLPSNRVIATSTTVTQQPAAPDGEVVIEVVVGDRETPWSPNIEADLRIVGRVLLDGVVVAASTLDTLQPESFSVDGAPFGDPSMKPDETFIVTDEIGSDHKAEFRFSVTGATNGQELVFQVFAIEQVSAANTSASPDFVGPFIDLWSHSGTPQDARTVGLTL